MDTIDVQNSLDLVLLNNKQDGVLLLTLLLSCCCGNSTMSLNTPSLQIAAEMLLTWCLTDSETKQVFQDSLNDLINDSSVFKLQYLSVIDMLGVSSLTSEGYEELRGFVS